MHNDFLSVFTRESFNRRETSTADFYNDSFNSDTKTYIMLAWLDKTCINIAKIMKNFVWVLWLSRHVIPLVMIESFDMSILQFFLFKYYLKTFWQSKIKWKKKYIYNVVETGPKFNREFVERENVDYSWYILPLPFLSWYMHLNTKLRV